jgi:hypothetical protein
MEGACSAHGKINAYKILTGKPKGRGHSEYLGVDRRIILKFISNK